MDTGSFSTYGGIRVSKVKEAIAVMLEQHQGLVERKLKISPKELNKAKEFYKGYLAIAMENTSEVNMFYGMQGLFLDEIMTPEQVFKKIDSIKVGQLYKAAEEIFTPQTLNLAIIGPFDDKKVFEKLIS